jgi:hypothetical protein
MLTKTDDLKDRVEAKRAELRARMKALKVDSRHDVIVAATSSRPA